MMQIIDKSTRYDVTICHHGMANLQVACPSPPTRPSPTASRRTTRWRRCRFRHKLGASFAVLSGALAGLKELFWQCGVRSCGELAGFAYCA